MAEARRLRTGRWRIYEGSEVTIVRDPKSGVSPTFASLQAARDWWADRSPGEPALEEAIKCARCGGYFGLAAEATVYAGRYYHAPHTPQAVDLQRRR